MEFVKAIQVRNRMCVYYKDVTYQGCNQCPLSVTNNNTDRLCHTFVFEYPADAERILEQWDKEHPARTFKDDFFEKHPNAPMSSIGGPVVCLRDCGYLTICPMVKGRISDCKECWNTPMEDN